jgi:hypothetical protein
MTSQRAFKISWIKLSILSNSNPNELSVTIAFQTASERK